MLHWEQKTLENRKRLIFTLAIQASECLVYIADQICVDQQFQVHCHKHPCISVALHFIFPSTKDAFQFFGNDTGYWWIYCYTRYSHISKMLCSWIHCIVWPIAYNLPNSNIVLSSIFHKAREMRAYERHDQRHYTYALEQSNSFFRFIQNH